MSWSRRADVDGQALAGLQRRGGYARTTFGTVRTSVLLLAKTLFVPLASAAPLSRWQRDVRLYEDEDTPKSTADPDLYLYLGIAVGLVLLGGVFAGLTIALMGQDETYLQVIATSGEGSEKKSANKVLRLLKKGKHWVLVTLLLGNVITNETLPIVLDRSLGGGWPAVLSSTVLIVIFGEIAPQSVCVRYGLGIGAFMAPFVLVLMWILAPVAWPTAKLLDWLLGQDHGTYYKKAGLKTLVQLHKTLGTIPGESLVEDEVTIINSVLDLKEKPVGDIMTPMQDVFIMSADTVLDERMMDTILSQGYSRIPIYAPDNNRNFIGMLLVKILITYDPEDAKRVRDFALATLPETRPYTSCLDIINFFQEGKSHMVLVSDFPGQARGALGVVTLEDVIEELIGEEIVDESDVFLDVHKAIRRMAPAPRNRYVRNASQERPPNVSAREVKEADDETDPLLGSDVLERKPSIQRTPTTFLMRRKSSVASDPTKGSPATAVKASTSEMREHLKHLGPSNAASNPRSTKIASVISKPGVGTIPENQATTTGISTPDGSRPPLTTSASVLSDETSRLLRSAGKDASDGAAALRSEYGTVSGSFEPPRVRGMSADRGGMDPAEASKFAEEKASEGSKMNQETVQSGDKLRVPGKLIVGDTDESSDKVGNMEAPSRERSKSRRGVRSGSITETHVDVGGISKMVLETTSSSSDVDDEASSSKASHANGAAEDDEDTTTHDNHGNKKKRKKRGKKKKGGGS